MAAGTAVTGRGRTPLKRPDETSTVTAAQHAVRKAALQSEDTSHQTQLLLCISSPTCTLKLGARQRYPVCEI
jgi:hypothetical protein